MAAPELLPVWLLESPAFSAAAGEAVDASGPPIVRRRRVHLTAADKARWLDGAATIGATLSVIRDAATTIAAADPASPPADALYRWVRDRIVWAEDPGDEEQFASPDLTLERAFDDCDGKACLFVALCRALGIEARIRAIFDGEDFVHVQGLVRFPGSSRDREALPGGWLVAELILPDLALGEGAEARYRKGFQ